MALVHRRRLLAGVPADRSGRSATTSARSTRGRSSSSPTRSATARPTSSPPASRITGSARSSACHDNTGAGGANVWDHDEVLQQLALTPNPFVALPGGAEHARRGAALDARRRAVRRSARRSRRRARRALLHDARRSAASGNVDLIAHAAKILKGKPTADAADRDHRRGAVRQGAGEVDEPRSRRSVRGWPSCRLERCRRGAGGADDDRPAEAGQRRKKRIAANGYRKDKLVVSARL